MTNRKDLRKITLASVNKCGAVGVVVSIGDWLCSKCRKVLSSLENNNNTVSDSCVDQEFTPDSAGPSSVYSSGSVAASRAPRPPPGPGPAAKRGRFDDAVRAASEGNDRPCQELANDDKYSADDAKYIIGQLKIKYRMSTSVAERLQILSLVPPSWSESRVCSEFSANRYQVTRSRELVEKSGVVLPSVESRYKRPFDEDVIKSVQDFYEDETVSYCTPGMNQYVVVRDKNNKKVKKQKKLLLCNLDVLFKLYKDRHPSSNIGRSKFAHLRPRHCVYVGAPNTQNVCVCEEHQNVVLQCHALLPFLNEAPDDVKCVFRSVDSVLANILCNPATVQCYSRQCSVCKPKVMQMKSSLIESIKVEKIEYSEWGKYQKKTTLKSKSDIKVTFANNFVTKVAKLALHDFTARMQISAMTEIKNTLKEGEVLVCGDFAENFTFVVQNSAQGQHWNNSQATIHPFVCYYRSGEDLKHVSFVIISDCMDHDTMAVYTFQKQLVAFLSEKLGNISKMIYFTDGCSAQYKNKDNFINLCFHEEDFGIAAEWNFFATSHGKGACDGVGGTVKREARRACLQSPFQNLIGSCFDLYNWCKANLLKTNFKYVSRTDVMQVTSHLEARMLNLKSIPGTRSFHCFLPLSPTKVQCKQYSLAETGVDRCFTRRRPKST